MAIRWQRPTVLRLGLAVAISAILLHLVADQLRGHRERLLEIANNHARIGANYRQHGATDPTMQRFAAWHEWMRQEFVTASDRPWLSPPRSQIVPPTGWSPPQSLR